MSADESRLRKIDDYTSGTMSDADADAFESELFAAASHGVVPELLFLDTLKHISPWFGSRGGFSGGATRAQVDQLLASPYKVHYFEIGPGRSPVEKWRDGFDLIAYRVGVDLRGCEDVDVFVSTPEGKPIKEFRDCQFDPTDGALYGVCDEPLARSAFWWRPCVARVEATRSGKRETIATMSIEPVPGDP